MEKKLPDITRNKSVKFYWHDTHIYRVLEMFKLSSTMTHVSVFAKSWHTESHETVANITFLSINVEDEVTWSTLCVSVNLPISSVLDTRRNRGRGWDFLVIRLTYSVYIIVHIGLYYKAWGFTFGVVSPTMTPSCPQANINRNTEHG